jgi:ABC-2 type transport system ATP-binding protein
MENDSAHVVFEKLGITRDGRSVFNGISGTIHRGSVIGFWGANGSGKTTLLEILAGWRKGDCGQVTWPSNHSARPILIPTSTEQFLFPWYKVEKNLGLFQELAEQRGCDRSALEKEKQRLADVFGLKELTAKCVHRLSSGQKARVAIACGLLFRPSVLMLDELFMHIDWATQKQLADCLRNELEAQKGMSLILVAHSASPVLGLAKEIWVFGNQTQLEQRNAQDFLTALKEDISQGAAQPKNG